MPRLQDFTELCTENFEGDTELNINYFGGNS